MALERLSININEYVREAFYSIPDFTDGNGKHIGGIYGAFFKLIATVKNGGYSEVSFSYGNLSESGKELTKAVTEQVETFTELIKSADDNVTEDNSELIITVSDGFTAKLSEIMATLSPNGQVKALPQFDLKMSSTSDLNEVEGVFKEALEYGKKSPENYVAFYFLTDTVATEGSKYRNILGLSLCFDESKALYIPVENFITADYLGRKLSELSEYVSLVTFDIKESYRVFTPQEIVSRTCGYGQEGCEDYASKPRCFDVLIGAYLVDPNKNDYEPFDVAKEYLGLILEKKTDHFGKKGIDVSDEKKVSEFACKTSYVCLKSAPLIRKKLSKLQMEQLFYNVEMPLSYVLYAMEKEGIIAKQDELKAYGEK